MEKLGTVENGGSILTNADVGVWAVEVDDGKPGRMYADATMLKLMGMEEGSSPEEVFKVWYESIDHESVEAVLEYIQTMYSGKRAEIQYPWHHPDGSIRYVRCGGVRNFEYTKGIRTEGTHQDLTEMVHMERAQKDAEEDRIRLREQSEIERDNERLRADALLYITEPSCSMEEFFNFFGKRIIAMTDCDKVAFRNMSGLKIMINKPGVLNPPPEVCMSCPFCKPTEEIYDENGILFMNDTQSGHNGLKPGAGCKAKSSLMKLVYANGKLAGVMTIHYINNSHEFTQRNFDTFETFTQILGVIIEKIEAREAYEAQIRLEEALSKEKAYNQALEKQHKELQEALQTADIFKKAAFLSACGYYVADLTADKIVSDIYRISGEESVDCYDDMPREATRTFSKAVEYFAYECVKTDSVQFLEIMNKDYLIKSFENGFHQREVTNWVNILEKENICIKHVAYLSYDESTGHVMATCILYDVTDQIEEQEMAARRINTIMRLSEHFEAIYDVDTKSGNYRLYSDSEKTLARLSGESDDFYELESKFEKVIFKEDRDAFRKMFNRNSIENELSVKRGVSKDYRIDVGGEPVWYRTQMVKYHDKDGERVIIGVFDVNDRYVEEKKKQQELEEALDKARAASNAKTVFLNNMSHDIRTPMNAIMGYTDLAKSHINDESRVEEFLDKIGKASGHLLSLINDVLDMSRIESGKLNIHESSNSISDMIHTIKTIFKTEAESNKIDFSIVVNNVTDETVMCDKLHVNQVLMNVASNAIKYTQSGGKVLLEISEKDILKEGYALYEFVVEDNGIGMSEEFLKTVFDPFIRAKSSTVSGVQGTGLGMSIAKTLVDMMGGSIKIESKLQKGTRVTLSFCFKFADKGTEDAVPDDMRLVNCLVVDGNPDECKKIVKLFEKNGIGAQWCISGLEAVDKAKAVMDTGEAVELFWIGSGMLGIDGEETADRIRKLGDSDKLKIVIMDDESIEKRRSYDSADMIVERPLFASDVSRTIATLYGINAENRKEKQTENRFDGKHLLLVEDNEMNREIAKEVLTEYGFAVETADDGIIAVNIIRNAYEETGRLPYDLILMDIQMPVLDGYSATAKIRKILENADFKIPIVAMTANAFEQDREKAMAVGMDDYIAKPIDVRLLRETLSRLL